VRRRPTPALVWDVAFFASVPAYAWGGIDTRLIHHWQGPAFYAAPWFFTPFLKYPGGAADCLYAWIAQFY